MFSIIAFLCAIYILCDNKDEKWNGCRKMFTINIFDTFRKYDKFLFEVFN